MRQFALWLCLLLAAVAPVAQAQVFCTIPSAPPPEPPQEPPHPHCERCEQNCRRSPCYVGTGSYVAAATDLRIRTIGFPIAVSRHYNSHRVVDGPVGIGWTSTLTPRLYNAAYAYTSPTALVYMVYVVLPDGFVLEFQKTATGTYTSSSQRLDTLVQNGDGSWDLQLELSSTVMHFASNGSLSTMKIDYGVGLQYTYDANGRVTRVADLVPSGRYVDVTWGATGRIAAVTDHTGRVIRYKYDEATGTLVSADDPVTASLPDEAVYYLYTAGRFGPVLSKVEDRWHRTLTDLTWYPDGRLKSYTQGAYDEVNPSNSPGEKYTYNYVPEPNAEGYPHTQKTDSLGLTDYKYGTTGLVSELKEFSPQGLPTRISDIDSEAETLYQYDAAGRTTSSTTRLLNDHNIQVTWNYTYDPAYPQKVATARTPNPDKWQGLRYTYYGAGNPAPGALKTVEAFRKDGVAVDLKRTFEYNNYGQLTKQVASDGATTYTYNSAGDLLTVKHGTSPVSITYTYDVLGRITKRADALGHETSYTYDLLDRQTTVTLPKPSPSFSGSFVTTYAYDQFDSSSGLVLATVTDPNNRVTSNAYDALNHLRRSTDTSGRTTTYTYKFNLLHKITDPNGNVTSYAYNAKRLLASTTFPDAKSESYTYYAGGSLQSVTDRRGTKLYITYDYLGRVSSSFYPDPVSPSGADPGITYAYDGTHLTAITDRSAAVTRWYQFTYDSSFRPSTESMIGGYTLAYTYLDPGTEQIQSYTLTPPTSRPSERAHTVSYSYDSNGRVHTIGSSLAPAISINYDALDRYATISLGGGAVVRHYSYDDQGRLTSVSNTGSGNTNDATYSYAYDYDWSANTYSMLGQRTSMTVSAPLSALGPGTTKYYYDADYQLVRSDAGTNAQEWAYDALGNRTYTKVGGTTVASYTYGTVGTNPLNWTRLLSDGTRSYAYDAAGNTTAVGTTAVTWNQAGQMASYGATQYTYDYTGHRDTRTTSGGAAFDFVRQGLHTARMRSNSGQLQDYIYGPGIDEPLAVIDSNGSVAYPYVDGLGSIVTAATSSGVISGGRAYTPFGESTGSSDLHGYTARESEPAGLYYYRARYYNPALGRFMSEDPITRPSGLANVIRLQQGPSKPRVLSITEAASVSPVIRAVAGQSEYAYVRSRPTNATDPLGLLGEPNQRPLQPYCDWGQCTPPVCPPPWCQPFMECVQRCVDIFIPSNWLPGATLTALTLRMGGPALATYQGAVVLICINHCVAFNGCVDFPEGLPGVPATPRSPMP